MNFFNNSAEIDLHFDFSTSIKERLLKKFKLVSPVLNTTCKPVRNELE